MAQTNIPDAHHVLRWARPKEHLLRDHAKKIVGCDHALFKLRTDAKFIEKHRGPEKSISVNYVEHVRGTDDEMLQKTVTDYQEALKNLPRPVKLSKKALFAKINVGKFKDVCQAHRTKVRIVHDAKPTARMKSHGSINQLSQDNALLFDDLCTLAFKNLMSAEEFLKIQPG